jgi:hypothetical protein
VIAIIVRDGKSLSLKASFVADVLKTSTNADFLYAFRKEEDQFTEKTVGHEICLATSITGIILYFALMYFLKSPKDMRDGIIRRLHGRKNLPMLIRYGGFTTVLSQAMYQYFARSARTDNLLRLLEKMNPPRVFLIDEFFSLNVIDLKNLKDLGSIVYVSSDVAHDFYKDNTAASKLMYKFEKEMINLPDLIIACSERDRLKYSQMGSNKVIYYPNIYPLEDFELRDKDPTPSMSIVLREHWGSRTQASLEEVFQALGFINRPIKVYMIGAKPAKIPKNVELHFHDYIPSKLDYMKTLSKAWFGINLGVHSGGANQRKYDYAMAGLVVLSDTFGARGDLLPHEYTYVDSHDLAAKFEQLLELGKNEISQMGEKNRKQAFSLARRRREDLQKAISDVM